MIEQWLYGVQVFTEFELFEAPGPGSAKAPGEACVVSLSAIENRQIAPTLPQMTSLYFAHNRELFLHTDRELNLSVAGEPWCLEVKDVVTFSWLGGDSAVDYQLHEHGTQQRLVFWFVHIFLPLYLTVEKGHDFIHAAAVEVAEQPILLLAPSTGGKSTLGDYFLKQGHTMMSDDKVATFFHEGQFYAVPSHPHHRPWREYEVLGDPVDNFAASAKPIQVFYLLEKGGPDSAVEISEVMGFRKFEELMPNYLYSFRFLQEQRLRWLAQLADSALVFRVRRPWNLGRMDEVYQALCDHAAGL